MMGIRDQVVLVTGAGSGLGAAAAAAFAQAGAKVVLCGRRKQRLDEIASRISAAGGEALAVQADVTSPSEVENLVRAALSRFGRIDTVINNAAVFEAGTTVELSFEAWSRQISTNLNGVFLVTKTVLPTMRTQKHGRIINITSGMAPNGAGGFAAYAAAKAGVESLTRTVAEDEESSGILCNMYNPGPIKTEMHATGKDPSAVTEDLIRLAELPTGGATGQLFEAAV
ncbi:SDR family NAD(P)-dependent oxidoreductase [Gorillibacterium sp. sgz5001074]|uniref:SDR family NAD(P)-dependent oxidoreductase n=1 Tax=Gorillibacterium sp. sgz5001074 TaxID=3446695 RepID=UPI003F671568